MDESLISLLKKDPLQSLPVFGFFGNYPLEEVFQSNGVLLLTGTSDAPWAYLAGNSPQGMLDVLEQYRFRNPWFANVEEWMLPLLLRHQKLKWELKTLRYYLPEETVVDPPADVCQPLSATQVPFIYENTPYRDYTHPEYIAEGIRRDVSAGYFKEGQLCGWGLTHDDGSLGFLNVLEPFRRQGIGEMVLRSLIAGKRKRNQPVFANIEPHNQKSIKLAEKLGFRPDRLVSWVKLK